jgi:hypothetical protein
MDNEFLQYEVSRRVNRPSRKPLQPARAPARSRPIRSPSFSRNKPRAVARAKPQLKGRTGRTGRARITPSQNRPADRRRSRFQSRISSRARRFMARRGLLTGAWRSRFSHAPRELILFANRLSETAGFELAIAGLYGYPFQRRAALAAQRLALRLIRHSPDIAQRMAFESDLAVLPDGHLVPAVDLVVANRRWHFRPWPVLDHTAVQRQFARDRALMERPGHVRWVLDGQRLGMDREAVIEEIRRILEDASDSRADDDMQSWLDALDSMVIISGR